MSEIKVNSIKGVGASAAAITVNNTDGTCAANISSVSGGQLGNRNMIINGAMQISQRGATFTSAVNSAYQLDRYKFVNGSSGVFTISQSTTSPDGFSKSWKIVPTTQDTLSGTETVRFMQPIEGHNLQSLGKGTSGAKKSVLSFYVKTNKTGVYSVFLYDADNNRQFNAIYTVSDTNWNRYTIDVPADTTGAYGDDNGGSLEIIFHLAQSGRNDGASLPTTWISYGGNGSEARGHTATFADSTSNEYYITGIQYEVNESGVATDFEHRSFGDELARCQRYFFIISGDNGNRPGIPGFANSGSNVRFQVTFPNNMRALPSITGTATDCVFDSSNDSATFQCNGLSSGGGGTQSNPHIMVIEANPGGMSAGQGGHFEFRATGSISFSSEL